MSDARPSDSASGPAAGGEAVPEEPEPSAGTDGDGDGDGVTGFAAFRYRDFRYFYFGKAFAVGSFHMIMVAIGYQVYDMTGDALTLALLNLTMFLPAVTLVPFTGYVADSVDRRLVLIGCYVLLLGTAISLSLLTLLSVTVIWPYYLTMFFAGAARAFYGPTTNAILPSLVPLAVFPNSVAWNTSAGRVAQIFGPAAGGFLYLFGPETVYVSAAAIYVVGGITTAMLRPRPSTRRGRGVNLRAMFSGIRYVAEKRIILGAVVVDLLMMFMGGVQALLPIFAKDILGVGAAGAGILRSSMAVGGLLAALALTRVPIRRKAGTVMLVATAFFGLGAVVFGLSTAFWLSVASIAVIGACDIVAGNIRITLMQIATPDSLRGRVGAVSSLASNMGSELGGFRAGTFTVFMGPEAAVVVGGVVVIAVAIAAPRVFPDLARVERMDRVL